MKMMNMIWNPQQKSKSLEQGRVSHAQISADFEKDIDLRVFPPAFIRVYHCSEGFY
jgi:hypothetical protein